MTRPVKPQRTYDSTRRRAQAREARRQVLTIARQAFLESGYAATTVGSIAADAGVSVEMIYKAFGNKAGILKAMFDVAIVGDDEPLPLQQREMVAQIDAEPDGHEKLRIYGEAYAVRAERAVPVQLLVRDAATSDPAARDVWKQLQEERLSGMTAFAQHLKRSKVLRRGVTVDEARDVLYAHTSAELYEILVLQRQWTPKRFGRWITQQLTAALLP